MKISFKLEDQDDCIVYQTKEEWAANIYLLHNFTPRHAPASHPDKFPCIAIQNGWHDDPNGPYMMHYAFIYDFNLCGSG